MVRVGLVGFGFMGQTHFGIYKDLPGAELVAIADVQAQRRQANVAPVGGNIPGEGDTFDLSGIQTYENLQAMLAGTDVDIVDICLPTFLHADNAVEALKAGKAVLCEKPMALTPEDCQRMIDAANTAGRPLMVAHCIRFWPEYEVLRDMINKGTLGELRALKLTRESPMPGWAWENWLPQVERGGGAILDLHIHDTDYLISLFGKPKAVKTQGVGIGGPPVDHVVTQYTYDQVPVCAAEGTWIMPDQYPFHMDFEAVGTEGTLRFINNELTFFPQQGEPTKPSYEPKMGYELEIAYFVDCVEKGIPPDRVPPEESKLAVEVIAAERKSAETGEVVTV